MLMLLCVRTLPKLRSQRFSSIFSSKSFTVYICSMIHIVKSCIRYDMGWTYFYTWMSCFSSTTFQKHYPLFIDLPGMSFFKFFLFWILFWSFDLCVYSLANITLSRLSLFYCISWKWYYKPFNYVFFSFQKILTLINTLHFMISLSISTKVLLGFWLLRICRPTRSSWAF